MVLGDAENVGGLISLGYGGHGESINEIRSSGYAEKIARI